jgi:hypothetical protein
VDGGGALPDEDATEMALHVLAHLKRVMRIIGVGGFIEAICA